MKKSIIALSVILSLGLVGCDETGKKQSDENLNQLQEEYQVEKKELKDMTQEELEGAEFSERVEIMNYYQHRKDDVIYEIQTTDPEDYERQHELDQQLEYLEQQETEAHEELDRKYAPYLR